jgi:hypothetical protein
VPEFTVCALEPKTGVARRGTVHGISGRPPQGPRAALVVAASRRRPDSRRPAPSFSEVGPASSGHAAEQRPPSNNESAGLLGGRFNASSTIPVHGAGPWVLVETPTRHHPRRRGRPIPRRLLLGWSERVRIRQRLRAHVCAGSGRTPGATPPKQCRHHARTRRGFFGNPRLFCAPTLPRRRSPAGARRRTSSRATRPGASPPTSPNCLGVASQAAWIRVRRLDYQDRSAHHDFRGH